MPSPVRTARELFPPIAPSYERWARALSFGQDGRWRSAMVEGLTAERGARVLDVAAGTGSITRLLVERGFEAVMVDQSREMLAHAGPSSPPGVVATGETLPFASRSFDVVTFGYLLRYVDDVPGCLAEIARVLRSGGAAGMVEFGRPSGVWRWPWRLYTRLILPAAGAVIAEGWKGVGRFLGPSIDGFHDRYGSGALEEAWRRAGFENVRSRVLSLGGGLVMWGAKR